MIQQAPKKKTHHITSPPIQKDSHLPLPHSFLHQRHGVRKAEGKAVGISELLVGLGLLSLRCNLKFWDLGFGLAFGIGVGMVG